MPHRRKKVQEAFETLSFVVAIPLPSSVSERMARECCRLFSENQKNATFSILPPETYHVSLADVQEARADIAALCFDRLEQVLRTIKPFQARIDGLKLREEEKHKTLWAAYHDSEDETRLVLQRTQEALREFQVAMDPPEERELHVACAFFKDVKDADALSASVKSHSAVFGRFNVSQVLVYEYGGTGGKELICLKHFHLQGGENHDQESKGQQPGNGAQ